VSLDLGEMQINSGHDIAMTATGDGLTRLTLADGGWADGTVVRVLDAGTEVASGVAQGGAVSLDVPFEGAGASESHEYVITSH
jgi:hypothetical protein